MHNAIEFFCELLCLTINEPVVKELKAFSVSIREISFYIKQIIITTDEKKKYNIYKVNVNSKRI